MRKNRRELVGEYYSTQSENRYAGIVVVGVSVSNTAIAVNTVYTADELASRPGSGRCNAASRDVRAPAKRDRAPVDTRTLGYATRKTQRPDHKRRMD